MKHYTTYLFILLIASFVICPGYTHTSLWTLDSFSNKNFNSTLLPGIITDSKTYILDTQYLESILQNKVSNSSESGFLIELPIPTGEILSFSCQEYQIMQMGLAAKYSHLQAFIGHAIDNNGVKYKAHFDVTDLGFRASIQSINGQSYIEPITMSNTTTYKTFYRSKYHKTQGNSFTCKSKNEAYNHDHQDKARNLDYCGIQTYRLAIATTGEYSNFLGAAEASQSSLVMSAVLTTINRVNQIYERDLGIRLVLVDNTDLLFHYNGNADPYTNNDVHEMLSQNQQTIPEIIGLGSFDIGHVFATSAGGIATLHSPCNDATKARGVSGTSQPIGDAFHVDYVAHEMGHQFGANHTFNNACGGTRNEDSAYEPGSGTTIMAYAGLCTPNVQQNSDPYFHSSSIQKIRNFTRFGQGALCAEPFNSEKETPKILNIENQIIPVGTPFVLSIEKNASASQNWTYNFEQIDSHHTSTPISENNTFGPLFRSYPANSTSERHFPSKNITLENAPWEILPEVDRQLSFRYSIFDYEINNYSCFAYSDFIVTATSDAGPFVVSHPNQTTSWIEGSIQEVTWEVNGTDQGSISCNYVNIWLSLDGGENFSTLLASEVPNNGSRHVVLPRTTSEQAKIKIEAVGHLFYCLSEGSFTINPNSLPYTLEIENTHFEVCQEDTLEISFKILDINESINSYEITVEAQGANFEFETPNLITNQYAKIKIFDFEIGVQNIQLNIQLSDAQISLPISYIVSSAPSLVSLINPIQATDYANLKPSLSFQAESESAAFEIEIADNPAFVNAMSYTTYSSTYTLKDELNPSRRYYWRARQASRCKEGQWSGIGTFVTLSCVNYNNDTDLHIQQGEGTTYSSSYIEVPTDGQIVDVNVKKIVGTHHWVSDLDISLIKDETEVLLWQSLCGSSNDFSIAFNSEAELNYEEIPCAPLGDHKTFKSKESLDIFNGKQVQGIWQLKIGDKYNGGDGTLLSWSIEVCHMGELPDVQVPEFTWQAQQAIDNEDKVTIIWAVKNEAQTKMFYVQHFDTETQDYVNIDSLLGNDSSWYQDNNYLYDDLHPQIRNTNIYRIARLNLNNQWEYSPQMSVLYQGETPTESDNSTSNDGEESITSNAEVTFFPNPAVDVANIRFEDDFVKLEPAQIKITNSQGYTMWQGYAYNSKVSINIEHWQNGIYAIHARTSKKFFQSQLMVLR